MVLFSVTVDWGDYEPFDPGVAGPLHELAKRDAKHAFDRLMGAKEARIEALRELAKRYGVQLGTSDDAIRSLNQWFKATVEADPHDPERLRPIWYSVVNDIALYLGDMIIQRAPNIRWAFFDSGPTDISFQRHVLMGFTNVANPRYNVDIDRLVATYGHRVIAAEGVGNDEFVQWVRAATSEA